MRKIISLLFIIMLTFGLSITDASAKRFGGGRSFGMTRSVNSFSRTATPHNMTQQNYATQRNRWLGPITGLLAGGLLASLFMHNGLGSGLLGWALIAGIGLVIMSLLRKNRIPQSANFTPHQNTANWAGANYTQANTASTPPLDFDQTAFLREAQSHFYRLQTAYDQKNLRDIREFTTPEVFAEVQLQLNERGNESNFTEVVTLNSQLLDVQKETGFMLTQQAERMLASVQFSGLIREDSKEVAKSFNEIWHFIKETNHTNWTVAGIQQS